MKIKRILLISVPLFILSICFYTYKSTSSNAYSNNTLALYIENEKGEYIISADQIFPTTGYVLNKEKSNCKNGGILTQNEQTKAVRLNASSIDYCNLYFAKVEEPEFSITINEKKDFYLVNEAIEYKVKITNSTSTTLDKVKITPNMINSTGTAEIQETDGVTVDINNFYFENFKPGETKEIVLEYLVQRDDAITNANNNIQCSLDIETTSLIDGVSTTKKHVINSEDASIEQLYILTIYYIYETGELMFGPAEIELLVGEQYQPIYSPEKEGYTPNIPVVRLGVEGMPAENKTITVTYSKNT